MFSDMAGERRCQIIAQRQPLLVIILERKHAFIRAILIRQKFAQRLGKFDKRRFQHVKPVKLVNAPDLSQHGFRGGHVHGITIGKAAWQMGVGQRAG